MEPWMHVPGARVDGHRCVVRRDGELYYAVCTCGHRADDTLALNTACQDLVAHLADAVRRGATVLYPDPGDDGDPGAVREPRRPLPPHGTAGVALAPPAA